MVQFCINATANFTISFCEQILETLFSVQYLAEYDALFPTKWHEGKKKLIALPSMRRWGFSIMPILPVFLLKWWDHLFADTFYISSNSVYIINLYNTAFQFHRRNSLCTYRLNLDGCINVEYGVTEESCFWD